MYVLRCGTKKSQGKISLWQTKNPKPQFCRDTSEKFRDIKKGEEPARNSKSFSFYLPSLPSPKIRRGTTPKIRDIKKGEGPAISSKSFSFEYSQEEEVNPYLT